MKLGYFEVRIDFDYLAEAILDRMEYEDICKMVARVDELAADSEFTDMLKKTVRELTYE